MAGSEVVPTDKIQTDLLARRKEYNLSSQETAFVQEFLLDFDAERAYASTHEIMDSSDLLEGKKLSLKPHILSAVSSELRAQGERLFLKKEAILARVWAEALNMYAKTNERLKALEMAARMIGSLDYEKSANPPSINISITDPTFAVKKEDDIGAAIKEAIDVEIEK